MVNPISGLSAKSFYYQAKQAGFHNMSSEPETAISPTTGRPITAQTVTTADVPKLVAKSANPYKITDEDVRRDAGRGGIRSLIEHERTLK